MERQVSGNMLEKLWSDRETGAGVFSGTDDPDGGDGWPETVASGLKWSCKKAFKELNQLCL